MNLYKLVVKGCLLDVLEHVDAAIPLPYVVYNSAPESGRGQGVTYNQTTLLIAPRFEVDERDLHNALLVWVASAQRVTAGYGFADGTLLFFTTLDGEERSAYRITTQIQTELDLAARIERLGI